MKNIIVIILVIITACSAKTNSCGPDGIICKYEKMFQEYDSLRVTFPNEKALIKTLLRNYFVGATLSSQIVYLDNVPLSSYDCVILFPAKISKVLSYKVTKTVDDTMVIVKRVQEDSQAMTEEGSAQEVTVTYEYHLVKTSESWKIEKVVQL
jgi:hypothetical protein